MNELRPFEPFTRRNIVIFLCVFNFYLAYHLGNHYLLILGTFFLLLLLAGKAYASSLFRSLRIERRHLPRIFENESLYLELILNSSSPLPHHMVEVIDTLPISSTFYQSHLIPYPLTKAQGFSIFYKTTCVRKRGVYFLGPLLLRAADPWGIFPRMQRLEILTRLLVYPNAEDLSNFDLLAEGTLSNVGIETTEQAGRSEEFIGLREYRRGDPPTHIHWLSTAHHGKLMVKEFRKDIITEVSIFVDLSRLSHTGLGEMTSLEYSIKAAAAIARAATEKSHMVQLFALGRTPEHLPLDGGTQQLLTVLERLVFYKADREEPVEELITEQLRFLRPGSTAVFILSATNISLERMESVVRHLILERIKVIAILIDDRSFLKLWREQEILHQQAPAFTVLQEELARLGCRVFTLRQKDRIPEKLFEEL